MKLRNEFRSLLELRRSAKNFDASVTVPDNVVSYALDCCRRSPSSFNLQPYKVVVVRDELVKKQLAYSMMNSNIERVLKAPVTAVFLADLKPYKLLADLVELERKRGTPERVIDNLVFGAEIFVGSQKDEHVGEDAAQCAEMNAKRGIFSVLSQVTQAPTLNASAEAWGFKNTMLAAQTYLLAMTVCGFDSSPMEGFDARRVKSLLSVPDDRYSIPVVISSGRGIGMDENEPPSARFEFEDMFKQDTFDFPLYRDDDK
eukprot:CAMPEP_0203773118 /NCGR_PEP_ID=MMETSP0099_2-20121227/4463_1 /ASSEMBLY_ACC=CAM_ASM_000209 /TAXON_ID=96639 /ORGANISM=" , Strain NY0313808BC1" /LENGTH=257 /DNA_ID=CAMNT_0050670879 /DNA_START=67 /DNA_END=840 /DNA_ORIENTATION=+